MRIPFPFLVAAAVLLIAAAFTPTRGYAAETAPLYGDNVQLRGSFENSRHQFERQQRGNVAFLGGSITEMEGYRPMVSEFLKKRFPATDFTFTNAGIGSTCSTTGAFRLERDVLSKGPVDLLFVEFAVNDDQDAAHTRDECIRGMEGIIRHARAANPAVDIVVTFFVNEGMLETLQAGKTPLTVEAHEAVAKHYGVSTIHLAREVARQISAGKLTWKEYGGVHPAPAGNAICARMIGELLDRAWQQPSSKDYTITAHPVVPKPLDPLNYSAGRFVDPATASVKNGWKLAVPEWEKLPGGKRARFTSIPMLSAEKPGAELTLEFEGTAVGAYIVAGPDAGIVEVSIDGAPARKVDCYHRFSTGLHYPRTVMLGSELSPGKHRLTMRIAEETNSAGHAMRIMQFGVN